MSESQTSEIPFDGPPVPDVVRTRDECFRGLPGYPFAPHYVDVESPVGRLRMHYLDEGPSDGPVVLMVHGEPTWSYLYRQLVPVFAGAGCRAIAVDQIGFGRSDKLTRPSHYRFESHIDWLRQLVVALDLRDITLVCQDWGGPISMGVLAREPDRFARVAAGNTMLHTADPALEGRIEWAAHASGDRDSTVSTSLLDWMHASHRMPDFVASASVRFATQTDVAEDVLAAYDAPFPSEWHKAGMRQFPALIPVTQSDPGAALNRATWKVLETFDRPFLSIFSDGDPGTRGWSEIFLERIPGAAGQPHQTLKGAGHFWQEDCGAAAADLIAQWMV